MFQTVDSLKMLAPFKDHVIAIKANKPPKAVFSLDAGQDYFFALLEESELTEDAYAYFPFLQASFQGNVEMGEITQENLKSMSLEIRFAKTSEMESLIQALSSKKTILEFHFPEHAKLKLDKAMALLRKTAMTSNAPNLGGWESVDLSSEKLGKFTARQ